LDAGNFAQSHGYKRYIVRGKPYISVNKATMNAEYIPSDRQSLDVSGFEKLNAKIIKTAEFITTSHHRPYSDSPTIFL